MAFNPSRLILARKRRGLSKSELSRKSQLSLRVLGYYEAGDRTPSDETIETLAWILQFPAAFFFGADIDEIACDSASFRSLSTMTASQRDAALAAGTLAISLEEWISERFNLPTPAVPCLPNDDPENAARMLRAEWGIGERPISNIIHLVEAHGVRVFSLPIDSTSVDAFSVWYKNTPFIFLNTLKSAERSRMDVSHETGHLCMHQHGEPRGREAEHEANRFASALLMPAKDVYANVKRNIKLETIQKLKSRWQVAAIALVVRLYHLDLLTEWQYRSFCIELSKTNQRKQELNGISRESSQILGKIFTVLRSEGVTRNTIARDLLVTPTELNSLISGLTISAVPELVGSTNQSDNYTDPTNYPTLRAV